MLVYLLGAEDALTKKGTRSSKHKLTLKLKEGEEEEESKTEGVPELNFSATDVAVNVTRLQAQGTQTELYSTKKKEGRCAMEIEAREDATECDVGEAYHACLAPSAAIMNSLF